jgi:transcription elongation GreA/GreB family factor
VAGAVARHHLSIDLIVLLAAARPRVVSSAVSEMPDKRAALAALRAQLQEELDRFTRRALDAAEAATHEENRAEGDKDMRATEASYIARGQADRARDIEASLARLGSMELRDFREGDAIAVSAVVEVQAQGARATPKTTYFVVPVAGGVKLRVGAVDVLTIATSSPLGAALLGQAEGDEAEVLTPQGAKTYEILRVR